MQTIELNGLLRAASGKQEITQLKKDNRIPCVIYGGGENVHFSMDAKEIKAIIYTPNAYIIHLNIEGKLETVVMREVQFHPVYEQILHIDFYRITPGKPVIIDIPVRLTGNSEGVKQGGKLVLMKRKVRVSSLLENLPDFIEVDTTPMTLGTSFFVKDIKAENFTVITPASASLCSVNMTRAARGAAASEALEANKKKK